MKGTLESKSVNGNPKAALLYLEETLRKNPKHPKAWAMKSMSLRRLGRINEALDAAKKAVSYQPDDWRLWFNVVCYQSLVGFDFSEIKPNLERCLQIAGKHGESSELENLLDNDADLDSIRKLNEFKTVVAKS